MKTLLREHARSRAAYRALAQRWASARIVAHEFAFGRYYTAARFDRFYRASDDPWHYREDAVSLQRRDLLLGALPRPRYRRLAEIGCAEGWVTRRLAARTDSLLAADISLVALERARRECRDAPNVELAQLDLLADAIPGVFDAIVCAGVLVYVPRKSQRRVRDRIVASLEPGGDLLLEHTRDRYAGEVAGREIHRQYRAHPDLVLQAHDEVDNYAITVFRKRAP